MPFMIHVVFALSVALFSPEPLASVADVASPTDGVSGAAITGGAPHVETLATGNLLGGAFYRNQGQIVDTEKRAVPELKYYAFFNGARVYFTQEGWHTVYTVDDPERLPVSEATGRTLSDVSEEASDASPESLPATPYAQYRMDTRFVGCNTDVEIEASAPLARHLRYYLPHCADGVGQVPSFGVLRYRNLYDNIDLVLYAAQEGLKYEFEVRPGGRIGEIRMRQEGSDRIEEMADGSLRLHWPGGYTHAGRPLSYIDPAGEAGGDGTLGEIASAYAVEGDELGFSVGAYPEEATLIIDPWSTYYGGNYFDSILALSSDSSNAALATGRTRSQDFPVYRGWQMQKANTSDGAFIVKFLSTGRVSWATHFAGYYWDEGHGITVDTQNNIVIGGITSSRDLPVYNGFEMTNDVNYSGFAAKFDSSGARVWATYIRGGGVHRVIDVHDVASDAEDNIYLVGYTSRSTFPTRNAWQPNLGGRDDGFYMKLTKDCELVFSSFLGGEKSDRLTSVAVAADGRFAVGGYTQGAFPAYNARQSNHGGEVDAVIGYFDSSGMPLWITYHGGSGDDRGHGVCFDADGHILLGGRIRKSPDFPGLQDTTYRDNAYLSKFDTSGNLLRTSVYGISSGYAVAADSAGNAFIVGVSSNPHFPVRNPAFPEQESGAFVVKCDSAGVTEWATFFGYGYPYGAAVDRQGYLYVGGWTDIEDFPVFNAVQDSLVKSDPALSQFSQDAFIMRFRYDGYIPVTLAQISAQRVAGGVELQWLTESEVNVYGFMIECAEASGGAPEWTDIAFVPAEGGNMMRQTYRHVDGGASDVSRGYRYRLRMIDLDGSHEYSPVVQVAPVTPTHRVAFDAAYPSPARDWVTLRFTLPDELPVTLRVHDITGRELVRLHDAELLARGTHSSVFPVSDWRSGLYLATLTAGDMQLVRRVMVMR